MYFLDQKLKKEINNCEQIKIIQRVVSLFFPVIFQQTDETVVKEYVGRKDFAITHTLSFSL